MTRTEPTQGPWEASERGDYGDFDGESRVILGDDRRIAVVHHKGDDEDEMNSRILAASWSLYQRALAFIEPYAYLTDEQLEDGASKPNEFLVFESATAPKIIITRHIAASILASRSIVKQIEGSQS